MAAKSSKSNASGKPKTSSKTKRELYIAKEALREVEEKCQAIIDNIEDGYYEVDLEGHFTDFNDAMTRIAGRSRQELMGMNARDIMDNFHGEQAFKVFEKVYYTEMAAKAVDKKQKEYLIILEHNLNNITSSFYRKISTKYANLTTTEVEVANLVKLGKSIKEIAEMLNISGKTVEVHRMHIRKKVGIANTKTSLRTHLLSLG